MALSSTFRHKALIMWLSGLTGLVVGALLGWGLGVLWANATPPNPSEGFADLGRMYWSIALGLVLGPPLFVFLALRIGKAPKPLGSGFVFLLSSAAIMGILVWLGTLLLPVNIGIGGGAFAVIIFGAIGGAMVTARLIR